MLTLLAGAALGIALAALAGVGLICSRMKLLEEHMADLATAVHDAEGTLDSLKATVDALRATPPGGLTQAQAQALADELEAKVAADTETAAPAEGTTPVAPSAS